jgi:ankyrin repeat protein
LNGRKDVIELLLECKADPNIKNEFDKIPFEEALQNGFGEIGVSLKLKKRSIIYKIGNIG